jgi:hypothetical protein
MSRGALHPRGPARGPLARGQGLAGRAGLRLDARLRPRDGDPGARGDRPAAAPQPRRHVVGGDDTPQAGVAVDGDDARDDVAPAVRDPRRSALRLARQGPCDPHPGARGRRSAVDPVHHRSARGDRRDPHRARRDDLRAAPDRPALRVDPGSHRPELPREARHRHAARRRPRAGRIPRGHRRGPDRARSDDADPGSAQPRGHGRVPLAAGRGRRRLGRRLPADPRPRQPGAALALDRAGSVPSPTTRASSSSRG